LFEKSGGSLGSTGCVAWMFKKRGVITVDKASVDEDRLMEVALEAGADDVSEADGSFEVLTTPEAFESVKQAIQQAGIPIQAAEVSMIPDSTVRVVGPEAEQTMKLLEALEDHDDVQSVASNADFDQDELERLSA
jgi:transcriptional/translational regulatory protein YebC/TACO1